MRRAERNISESLANVMRGGSRFGAHTIACQRCKLENNGEKRIDDNGRYWALSRISNVDKQASIALNLDDPVHGFKLAAPSRSKYRHDESARLIRRTKAESWRASWPGGREWYDLALLSTMNQTINAIVIFVCCKTSNPVVGPHNSLRAFLLFE